jgi:hypothetical protein
MKIILNLGLFTSFLLFSASTQAQDYEYHPALSDNFRASVGWFKSDNTFKVSVNGVDTDLGEINLGDNVGVDDTNSLLNLQLRWNFGNDDKWSLWGQYFKNKASGGAQLQEDVEWRDVTFREGSFVGAGVSLEIIRLFAGYSFIKDDRSDFGAGIGIHNLDISTYIEGEILVDDGGTGFHRGEADSSQPLPNLGVWYDYSPARKWLLHARVDWISANIGDYDGTLWNTNVGVNYQLFRNIGIDLSYQFFNLDVGVDSSDWKGTADLTYSGPVISVTGNW